MTEEEIKKFLDDNKSDIQEAVRQKMVASLIAEHRWEISDHITKVVNEFIATEIAPQVSAHQFENGEAKMSLRDRCKEVLATIQRDGMLRQGNPVETLMAFVESERGKAADSSLKDTRPVILYFGNDADRDEFLAIVHEAKPGMIAKRLP